MTCPQCQLPNPVGTSYCARCGAPLQASAPRPPMSGMVASAGESKGLAITALVLGILSPLLACVGVGFVTALVAVILGIVGMVKAGKAPHIYGGKGMAIAGTILGGLTLVALPIVAAIAIPSLLRARVSANESAAIGDIRSVISAEAAYQSANGGYYDTLECLAAPAGCIPNYTGPVFVDTTLASSAVKGGYKRTFHPGAPAPASPDSGSRSPSSLSAFAYTAVPAEPNRTGVRGFCGDSSGRICQTMDGSEPQVVNGECAPDCRMLN
jgi:type II secretory pathway pseudopilin PulG